MATPARSRRDTDAREDFAMIRGWVSGALGLALVAGAVVLDHRAYHRGFDASEAKNEAALRSTQQQLDQAGREAAALERQLLAERAAREPEIRRLEDAARQDPDASSRSPSAASLQRLNRRWGAPPD
ncbi:MAG: hypothetical protein AAF346_19430 [Pseudomonadota bacterium]